MGSSDILIKTLILFWIAFMGNNHALMQIIQWVYFFFISLFF